MHVVRHIRHHESKVHGGIKICERLYVGALAGRQPDTFKTDGWVMFSDILAGQARAVDPSGKSVTVITAAGEVLCIHPPAFASC